MALLWCDGFDHYGLDETNMLDGAYGDMTMTLTTDQHADGTHSVLVSGHSGTTGSGGMRKVLPASNTKMGACGKFYFPNLPTVNTTELIYDFVSGVSTRSHVSVFVDSNGRLAFYKEGNVGLNGDVGTLIAQSDPCVTAAAWHHIEVQVYVHATEGWVRAAVNGVHVYQATSLDTLYDASGIVSVRQTRPFYGFANIYTDTFYVDSIYYYDFVGSSATDTDFVPTTDGAGIATSYIGELQVLYLPPNGDTAETDWVRSTGANDYGTVDELTPDDTDYIYSATVGDLSEFDLTDLPEEITYVRGLQLLGRLSKADAGVAKTKFGMNSTGDTSDAAERAITVEPTYWWDFINVDPDTNARWTRASLNAAKFRITRST